MPESQEIKPFPSLQNDLIIRAALGQSVEKVPVWIMRQAGRYLPEFRKFREEHDFLTICKTPELACEITLQPIRRFNLDAAIIFSDILVIPDAIGMTLVMVPGKGPTFPKPLNTPADLDMLDWNPDINKQLGYVFDAITLTRHKLEGKVPLIGFAGAPWTLFNYMVEGGSSTTQAKAKRWLYTFPKQSAQVMQLLTDVIIKYISGQIQAGAQIIQVFESHAGILGPDQFKQWCLPYLKQISEGVRREMVANKQSPKVPLIVFAKDAHYALNELSQIGYDVISLDWTIQPSLAREQVGDAITLQGNLDPCALYSPEIEKLTETMLQRFGNQRYIANLGHGIYPDMDPEQVEKFINTVHRVSENIK